VQNRLTAVLPVASALAGVAVTAWAQNRVSTQQRRHDREMRYFDDKRSAYMRYVAIVIEGFEAAPQTFRMVKAMAAAFERLEREQQHIGAEVDAADAAADRDRLQNLRDEAAALQASGLSELESHQTELMASLAGQPELVRRERQDRLTIDMYGPPAVRQAAKVFREVSPHADAPTPEGLDRMESAADAFFEVVQADLRLMR